MLRLRWSWRDLRQRWVQVLAIALIVSIGIGLFAALGSTARWRRESNDRSFAVAALHDLEVSMPAGITVAAGELSAVIGDLADPGAVAVAQERLVWPMQIEIQTADGLALFAASIVGAPSTSDIDRVLIGEGRAPAPDSLEVAVERNFATARGLAAQGQLMVGARRVEYVGIAQQPEYFYIVPEGGQLIAQGNQATLFGPLSAAQSLTGQLGMVNNLVVRLAPGADGAATMTELEEVLARAGVSASVTDRADEQAFRVLYADIESDQKIWNVVSLLVLVAALVAAFSLMTRVVESQRREIGIGMALGVRPLELAVRPLLVGLQVSLLGAMGGMLIGALVGRALAALLRDALPLPVWVTTFQPDLFVRAALIGLMLVFAATALPVLRAVRVTPIAAIRTTPVVRRTSRAIRVAAQATHRGPSTTHYALRNVVRAPSRALLTALALGAAVTVLVGVLGMLDSFKRAITTGDREATQQMPDRLAVHLSTFETVDGPTMRAIHQLSDDDVVVPGIAVSVSVRHGDHDGFDVALEVFDMERAPWSPTIAVGGRPTRPNDIVLSRKAADDLGLQLGDALVMRHPQRIGTSYRIVESEMVLVGLHPSPMRAAAFLGRTGASVLGLDGVTNHVQVLPPAGSSTVDVQRSLLRIEGVASALRVGDASDAFREALSQFTDVLRVTEIAVFVLALLIAFNASNISMDERRREHATMFAFGLGRSRVIGMAMIEAAVLGLLGSVVGLLAGRELVRWIFESLVATTLPEFGISPRVSAATALSAMLIAVVVSLAPMLSYGRLRRMDIPGALRVVE